MPNRSLRAAFILLCICALPAFAAPPVTDVAQVTVSPSMVQWRVLVPSESLTLRIGAPDGETYTFESKGQAINVTPKDLGESQVDGSFTYDLLVTPPIAPSVKAKLNEARKKNDDAAARKIARQAGLDRPQVASGTFAISGGSFVSPDRAESGPTGAASSSSASASSSATSSMASSSASETGVDGGAKTARRAPLVPVANDQVIPDDLIVQGSACIGLDCVNNESFGFDTVRLKENNTRIKFDDTSTSAGFPNVDWQLTANDSASGGASKFSIEDTTNAKVPFTVLANAPTNSLFVGSNGKLGLRTSTPSLDIHAVTSDTPAIRLEQTNAGGFTAQTWDIGANEANFFVRDLTGGSRLPFRIRPGAPTSSIDISAAGNVGIGTASPTGKFHVVTSNAPFFVSSTGDVGVGSTTPAARLYVTGGGVLVDGGAGNTLLQQKTTGGGHFWDNLGVGRSAFFRVSNAGVVDTTAIAIAPNGFIGIGGTTSPTSPIQHSSGAVLTAGGVWQNASSRELKQDICDLNVDDARDALEKLEPVTFAYKVDPTEHHTGFIAEDVPNLVAAKDRKSLSAMDIVAVLTRVVQDQQKTIEDLNNRIRQMEERLK